MYKKFIKRLLGIILSIMGLPIFLIILMIVSPFIYLEDKGPIFYCAPRIGQYGKIFKMLKFRSMKVNSPDIKNADGTTYNSEEDKRVTQIGHLLRKTSIDEIPQLLNVLKGDMSFIGPRPDLPGDDIKLYRPGDKIKLTVKPGITGYSQAYYRNSSTLDQRFDGDVYYAKNISLALDLKILLKTIRTVFTHENVYRN